MSPARFTSSGRTVYRYVGWSALPSAELVALKNAVLRSQGSTSDAMTTELLALIDRETAARTLSQPLPDMREP